MNQNKAKNVMLPPRLELGSTRWQRAILTLELGKQLHALIAE